MPDTPEWTLTFLGQLWGADWWTGLLLASLIVSAITTPLMPIVTTTLYYHLRGLSLKEKVLKEGRQPPTSS